MGMVLLSLIIVCILSVYFRLFRKQCFAHKEILNTAFNTVLDFRISGMIPADVRIKNRMPYLTKDQVEQLQSLTDTSAADIYSYIKKQRLKKTRRAMNLQKKSEEWMKKKYPWISEENIKLAYFRGLNSCLKASL
jgi:hypothetical protein